MFSDRRDLSLHQTAFQSTEGKAELFCSTDFLATPAFGECHAFGSSKKAIANQKSIVIGGLVSSVTEVISTGLSGAPRARTARERSYIGPLPE